MQLNDTYTDNILIKRGLHDMIISQEGRLKGNELLFRHLHPDLKILEVGCGPGTIAFQVSPHLRHSGYL